jgi:two-component system phosphate regulon sensor histidine kinase PhoR
VVDDSALDAERVRQALAPHYAVEVMGDGSEVLERLATRAAPDLLVLDWVMPGMTGVEVCRFLRSPGAGLPGLPVLLLTAQRDVQQIVEGMEAGANDYLAKPFAPEELLARVGALLRTRELLERAERAEGEVRALMAGAPDALFVVDAQGCVVYANEEGLSLVGRTASAALGARLEALLPGLSLRNISVAPGESLLPLPDVQVGARVYSPKVRVLPSDTAARTTVALRDVTDRREAELRRLDFYSVIAHDLRTPLTALLMRLEMSFRGKHGVLPATLVADLRKMDGNVRSLVAMINDFLDLARLEGVGHRIDREPVDLAALVHETLEEFRPLLDAHQLAATTDTPGAGVHVLGDRKRLAQVLSNLLGNAIKFTPPGGSVAVRVRTRDGYVQACVEDSGPGIAPEHLPTLFDRFTRVPSHEQVGGSGLGLMIVREIIHAHGGEVGVDSELGKGSQFWFRLPRATLRQGAA